MEGGVQTPPIPHPLGGITLTLLSVFPHRDQASCTQSGNLPNNANHAPFLTSLICNHPPNKLTCAWIFDLASGSRGTETKVVCQWTGIDGGSLGCLADIGPTCRQILQTIWLGGSTLFSGTSHLGSSVCFSPPEKLPSSVLTPHLLLMGIFTGYLWKI